MRLHLSISQQGLQQKQSRQLVALMSRAARITIAQASRWQLPQRIEISLLLTDDIGIQEINRDSRGLDKPTDVLSFPLWEEQPVPQSIVGCIALGDIIVSADRAAAQAKEYGHSFEREAVFLFVHGLLHLLGYDHELGPNHEKRMFALQEQIMLDLNLPRE